MTDTLHAKLNAIREEYRGKMNRAGDSAARHAAMDEMDQVSVFSTESERYREAFHALNRVMTIVEAEIP